MTGETRFRTVGEPGRHGPGPARSGRTPTGYRVRRGGCGEAAAAWARPRGRTDGPEFSAWLADRLEASSDSRYERTGSCWR